jgi:hypothetical protein
MGIEKEFEQVTSLVGRIKPRGPVAAERRNEGQVALSGKKLLKRFGAKRRD